MFTTYKVTTSSSILLYIVPVSIPVTRHELTGRGGTGQSDGEKDDEEERGEGGAVKEANRGGGDQREEGGA